MCGIQTVLVLPLLLAIVYARPGIPEGYGGRISHRLTDTATDVFGSNDSDDPEKWQSSSTATASADGLVSSKHNSAADVSVNTFADEKTIEKAILSDTKTANAYPIRGSDDLGRSSHYGRDTEYNTAAAHHRDVIPAWYHQIPTTGHGSSCHPGESKCRIFKNKPSSLNSRPTYNEQRDSSAGSSQPPTNFDGGWESKTTNSGSSPCTFGNAKCPGNQSGSKNADDSNREHVHVHPASDPCTVRSVECSGNHSGSESTEYMHQEHVNLNPGSGPCSSKNAKCSVNQSSDKNTDHLNREHDNVNPESGPCTSKDAKCSGNQSGESGASRGDLATMNPFLNGEIDVSDIQKAVKSLGKPGSLANQPNLLNPFFYPHSQNASTLTLHSGNPNGGDEVGASDYYKGKPNASNPSNPFLILHNQHPPHTKGDTHNLENPPGSDKTGTFNTQYSEIQPNPSNPVDLGSYPHTLHPSTATGGSQHSRNSNGSDKTEPFDVKNPEIHPNSSNPVHPGFYPHSLLPSIITSGLHHSDNPDSSDEVGLFDQHHKGMPNNPSNPSLNPNSKLPSTSPGGYEKSENPTGTDETRSFDKYHTGIPNNPLNSFLNSHNQHPSTATDSTHQSENPTDSNTAAQPSTQNPHNHRDPSNPSLCHNGHGGTGTSSSRSCNHNKGLDDKNDGKGMMASTLSYEVKTRQKGVKGGSARGHKSKLIEHDVSDHGIKASADASPPLGAYSKAHAVAISNAGGGSSAHASSQAYTSAGSSEASNSRASSSANASAFASRTN